MAKFFQKNKTIHDENKLEIVSDKSPFAYVEAYKTLRTNMNFLSRNSQYKNCCSQAPFRERERAACRLIWHGYLQKTESVFCSSTVI